MVRLFKKLRAGAWTAWPTGTAGGTAPGVVGCA